MGWVKIMDPDAALAEIRKLIKLHEEDARGDYARLLELIDSLDAWLAEGGFLPERWKIRS